MNMLMQAPDGGQMNVPDAKVAQYLEDGWKVISRPPEPIPSAPLAPALAAELREAGEEEIAPSPYRSAPTPPPPPEKKGKGK